MPHGKPINRCIPCGVCFVVSFKLYPRGCVCDNSVLKNEAQWGRVCDNSVVALNLVAPNQSVEHIFKNQTLDTNKKKLQDIPEASL